MEHYKKKRVGDSKLLLNNFDGSMNKLNLTPKYKDSKVEFNINFYNENDEIIKEIDNYHFYQQKTEGGIFNILALSYELIYR